MSFPRCFIILDIKDESMTVIDPKNPQLLTKRTVCVVTGSRSEFGILYSVIRSLYEHPELDCKLLATGSHIASSQGMTIKEIEKTGFKIDSVVPILMDGDSQEYIACSIGLGVIKISSELARLKPDFVILLGDRFEIFAAATAAMAMQIPIAHIAGGETDIANCIDGNIRNAITKMAHLHFVSSELYARRVKALGEESCRIFNVGIPSLDNLKDNLMSRIELEEDLGIKFSKYVFLLTYLPVGLRKTESDAELKTLLRALDKFAQETTMVFTLSNADAGGREINDVIKEYAKTRKHIYVTQSLGKKKYLSMVQVCDVVIGNSSSGIIEVPSFQKPTVNIGKRQDGRLQQPSVISVSGSEKSIVAAIETALFDENFHEELKKTANIFGNGNSGIQIANILSRIQLTSSFLEKRLIIE